MTNWATAKDFFEAQRPVEVVEVPGLGSIKILGLTAGEKDEYEDRVMNLDVVGQSMTMNNARAILLMMTVHDQHGNRMFSEKQLSKLLTIPAQIVDPILRVARRISAMGPTEINDLVKNSLTGRELLSSGSDTDSPDTLENPKPGSEETSAPTS